MNVAGCCVNAYFHTETSMSAHFLKDMVTQALRLNTNTKPEVEQRHSADPTALHSGVVISSSATSEALEPDDLSRLVPCSK